MPRKAVNSTDVDNIEKETVKTEKVTETDTLKKALEDSNANNKKLEKMLLEMQAKLDATNNQPIVIQSNQTDNNKLIKVINVQPYSMPIKTKDVEHTLDKFGSSHSFRLAHMYDISSKYIDWFKDGRLILEKQEDYKLLDLDYLYNDIPTLSAVKDIITFKDEQAVNKILKTDGDIRDIFERLIASAYLNKEFIDYNYIRELDKYGCKIEKLIKAEDSK